MAGVNYFNGRISVGGHVLQLGGVPVEHEVVAGTRYVGFVKVDNVEYGLFVKPNPTDNADVPNNDPAVVDHVTDDGYVVLPNGPM